MYRDPRSITSAEHEHHSQITSPSPSFFRHKNPKPGRKTARFPSNSPVPPQECIWLIFDLLSCLSSLWIIICYLTGKKGTETSQQLPETALNGEEHIWSWENRKHEGAGWRRPRTGLRQREVFCCNAVIALLCSQRSRKQRLGSMVKPAR